MRDRAERRRNNRLKKIRKRRLVNEVCWDGKNIPDKYIENLRLSSPYRKTNNKSPRKRGKHGNYAPSYNPPIRDKRRQTIMNID